MKKDNMGKKQKEKNDKELREPKEDRRPETGKKRWHDGLDNETKYSIWAIICLAFSLFLFLAVINMAGGLGEYVRWALNGLFGEALYLAPVVCFVVGISFLSSARPNLIAANMIGGTIVFLSSLGLLEIIFEDKTGGYIGVAIAWPFLKLVDFWASLVIFAAFFAVGILVMFNFSLSFARSFVGRRFQRQQSLFPEEEKIISESLKVNGSLVPDGKENEEMKKNGTGEKSGKTELDNDTEEYEEAEEKMIKARNRFKKNGFEMPPLDLLESDKGKPSTGDIKANANIIKRTLQTFGISVEMNEICVGPSVTQYTLKPAEGVKLTRITGLNNDLSLALAAHPIRIEAPIPGKSLVGIEVPNRVSSLVGLRGLFGDEEYKNSDLPLLVCLGRNVAGRPVYSSVSKMPHLLIAGTTGSGKSVSIHTLITSLLYRHAPWELQFIMIDAKRVELTVYNDIPYLLTPVVTEAKKAIQILKWATGEMERRYNRLLEVGARDIHSYHEKQTDSPMPYIVIVIDELADLMATYPRELEAAVVRLAQMSRAVGIHLILSTQRPSVEVITGLIKANIGTRIAFRVPQLVDSRTILDMSGAEKLLGNGDMLFMSGESGKPRRIQGAFIGEKEVKKVVNYIKNIYADLEMEGVNFGGEIEQASMFKDSDIDDGEDDGVYEQAREIVIKDQKASTSYLQRRLKLGYSRAARIMDLLQERGVVGPQDGSKAREVLIKDESGEF